MKSFRYILFAVITAIIIFAVDIYIPLGVAFGVSYIIVVLIALQIQLRSAVIVTSVLCTLLVLLGLMFSPEGGEAWKIYLNRAIAIFAIWLIALLGQANKQVKTEREKLLHDKVERIKELQCMYRVSESIRSRTNLREIFLDVVRLIPSGWHYSEITRGKLIFDEEEFVSEPFEETEWKQSCDIIVNGEPRGLIDVYYLEERQELDEGPFVSEERDLINRISRIISDAIERKQVEEAIKESERKYRGLLEFDPDGMVIVNNHGEIDIVNQQLQMITGYMSAELIGQTVEILIPERFTHHKQQRDAFIKEPLMRYMGEGAELFVQRKDGTEFPAEISLSPLETKDGLSISVTIRDISARKKAEDLLTFQANHDALTGLVNRREFERRTERLLSTVEQEKGCHALCYLDLDQFKLVNDTCGHTAGDELLRQISTLLLNTVRQHDTLARLGGDEFGVLIKHCHFEDAHRVATSILNVINDYQFTWKEQTFKVGASVGLVQITETTTSLTTLLRDADAACYMAKDKGRNRIHIYRDEDAETTQRHGEMQWVAHINQALIENRFCIYAQAIVPLDDSTEIHYEMLIRMIDTQGKIIPPGTFLPAAERYNLIEKIDRWMVEQVFSLLAVHPACFKQVNFVSINLSGQSLTREDFLEFIISQLEKTGLDATKICFEITETAAISNLSIATTFISKLKKRGCRFALDDFGSGLSSFGYLKNLPVDYLKIDGMFVKDIIDDPIEYAMVKSINEIGHIMGIQTIAEFVENDEIKDRLREIGVDYAQGYGIHKPQSCSELIDQFGDENKINLI